MNDYKYDLKIEYDDQLWEVMDNVNRALKPHGLVFIDDGEEHDGFCLYQLVGGKANQNEVRDK